MAELSSCLSQASATISDPKALQGKVSGRSSALSRPGFASTTYGMALTTRMVVDAIAPAPACMAEPEAVGLVKLAVMSQAISGSPSIRIRYTGLSTRSAHCQPSSGDNRLTCSMVIAADPG